MARLPDTVAIITGAARGMGAATARLFAAEGSNVMLTDIEDPTAVADEIGHQAASLLHDVGEPDSWRGVVQATVRRFGRIDVLINNAGRYLPSPLDVTTDENWDDQYRVNQRGVFLGMRAVLPAMRDAGAGSIVNVSSVAGLRGSPRAFAYTATKWAVRGMTKAAAAELAASRIRVNSIHPGLTETPMIQINGEDQNRRFIEHTPLGRAGRPEEVAQLVLYLASDESRFVTGAEVAIDGGSTLV